MHNNYKYSTRSHRYVLRVHRHLMKCYTMPAVCHTRTRSTHTMSSLHICLLSHSDFVFLAWNPLVDATHECWKTIPSTPVRHQCAYLKINFFVRESNVSRKHNFFRACLVFGWHSTCLSALCCHRLLFPSISCTIYSIHSFHLYDALANKIEAIRKIKWSTSFFMFEITNSVAFGVLLMS